MDILDQPTDKSRKKIYNPKTNRMIIINGSTYNKLLREGYMHWKEEGLLIPQFNEMLILREYLSFIPHEDTLALWIDRGAFSRNIFAVPADEDGLSARGGVEWTLRVQRHRRGRLRVVPESPHRRPSA